VLQRANATRYGLAAYVYTSDLSRAWRVAERLEFGIVGVNDPLPSTAQAPFGGLKESGIGREGGAEGMDAFLETKFVSTGIKA
jgi:succinate-semialdehyde dehydrogenase / glutarate-semialdehyde dehydrogenase